MRNAFRGRYQECWGPDYPTRVLITHEDCPWPSLPRTMVALGPWLGRLFLLSHPLALQDCSQPPVLPYALVTAQDLRQVLHPRQNCSRLAMGPAWRLSMLASLSASGPALETPRLRSDKCC